MANRGLQFEIMEPGARRPGRLPVDGCGLRDGLCARRAQQMPRQRHANADVWRVGRPLLGATTLTWLQAGRGGVHLLAGVTYQYTFQYSNKSNDAGRRTRGYILAVTSGGIAAARGWRRNHNFSRMKYMNGGIYLRPSRLGH